VRALAAVIVLTLLSVSLSFPQEPSTSVYPSEDELLEALRLGEINYSQYLILQEIILHGIDSTNVHLLDEIPNLSFFLVDPKSLVTSLEKEQRAAFLNPPAKIGQPTGTFGYKYYQELEQEGRAQYRSSGQFRINDHFEAAFKLHREYTGRERFVSRSLVYKNGRGCFKEFVLGNFSRRLGAGTIFGYRGKLLELSDRIDGESFLFPDYGGYNGLYTRVKFNNVETEALASVNRDGDYTLISAGGMISLTESFLRPGVIIGVNRLKNRKTSERLHDVKYGFSSRYRYGESYLSLELCGQAGEQSSWGGFVTEGRHRFSSAEIRYAAWAYADAYIDLTGGSKAGNLYHTASLDAVDFSYSEKRSGQEGGMLKSIVLLSESYEMINSILYAGRNRDSANVEFLSGLVRNLSPDCEIRLDYLNKTKKRLHNEVDQRIRLETRVRTGNLSARSYIAYNTKSSRNDYASVFMNLKYVSRKAGSVEIWSNLARFDMKDAVIDYWYAYIKSEQHLFRDVVAAMKLNHSYSRLEKHRTVVVLELKATI
jgi:hypothetical protein